MKFYFFKLIFLLQLFGCSSQQMEFQSQGKNIIYVVSQGWHTGLVISSDCIADSLWSADHSYNQFEMLLIGWGDTDYFQNKGFDLWYATKAAVWPTSSTIHIKAFNHLDDLDHLIEDKVKLTVNDEDYKNLCEYLQNQFQLDNQHQFIPQKAGYYQNSYFFESKKKYTALNNSNVWTGKALKVAGFNISPHRHLTQKSIIKKAKKIESEQSQANSKIEVN